MENGRRAYTIPCPFTRGAASPQASPERRRWAGAGTPAHHGDFDTGPRRESSSGCEPHTGRRSPGRDQAHHLMGRIPRIQRRGAAESFLSNSISVKNHGHYTSYAHPNGQGECVRGERELKVCVGRKNSGKGGPGFVQHFSFISVMAITSFYFANRPGDTLFKARRNCREVGQ